jgi:ankyrin repeat protein
MAAVHGHIDIVQLMLERGATNHDKVMKTAAKYGHVNIIELMLDDTKDYGQIIDIASKHHHGNIVIMLLKKFVISSNRVLRIAAAGGYTDIVRLVLEHNTTGYDIATGHLIQYDLPMIDAAKNGHIEIVRMMTCRACPEPDCSPDNYEMSHIETSSLNEAMREAAGHGHIEIVRLLLDCGATNYDDAMSRASIGGHIEIVRLLLDRGATYYNLAMEYAAAYGHIEIVQLMLDCGATDLNKTMVSASLHGYKNIVKLILEKGTKDVIMQSWRQPMKTTLISLRCCWRKVLLSTMLL